MSIKQFPKLSEAEEKKEEKKVENPWTIIQGGNTIISQHTKKETAEKRLASLIAANPDTSFRMTNDKPKVEKPKKS